MLLQAIRWVSTSIILWTRVTCQQNHDWLLDLFAAISKSESCHSACKKQINHAGDWFLVKPFSKWSISNVLAKCYGHHGTTPTSFNFTYNYAACFEYCKKGSEPQSFYILIKIWTNDTVSPKIIRRSDK
jgi:hypothetical protein